jgi:Ni,Fe-hydrogenase maturation factor
MKVYVFGNEDLSQDSLPFVISNKLKSKLPDIEFIKVSPNQDLPFIDEKKVVILDTIQGINEVVELNESDLDKLLLSKSLTVHDFDLGFQLKYLKKIGKIGKIMIVGIPMEKEINYLRIQSILRKLVAQDMQGS